MEVALAIMVDGKEPDEAILIGWPEITPLPTEGNTFIFDDEKYVVHNIEFNYCAHHGDSFVVHVVITLCDGADEFNFDDDDDGGIHLP